MTPDLNKIYCGDVLATLKTWPDAFVHCVVTSPPYWGLRDYGKAGQYGLEKTPEAYIETMVGVFRDVRRVLRDDGTLWLNMGDSYASAWSCNRVNTVGNGAPTKAQRMKRIPRGSGGGGGNMAAPGLKEKDLIGIPWMLAFALRADGWYLRSDIIWAKPNPMRESVRDRPTKAHEYLFLLAKSERYYYDAAAIKEPALFFDVNGVDETGYKDAGNYDGKNSYKVPSGWMTGKGSHDGLAGRYSQGRKDLPETQAKLGEKRDKQRGHARRHDGFNARWDEMEREEQCSGMRNKRSVWTVATSPFPEDLIAPCILAGCPSDGTVLDPFMGAGTTGLVAARLNRKFIGCEINPEYVKMAEKRIAPELAQGKLL